MGWTGLYSKPPSIPEYFRREWTTVRPDGSHLECLGQAFVGRFTLYGVWEHVSADGTKGNRFATVVLIRYGGKGDSCAWYYKDMDETFGPCEASCPKTLLKKLTTPAYNEYARAWRKECWRNALGLTKHSRIIQARRLWRRHRDKAIALIEDWNLKNPTNRIHYYTT